MLEAVNVRNPEVVRVPLQSPEAVQADAYWLRHRTVADFPRATAAGNEVRVTGKKRDDLQAVIALLRAAKIAMPLQYENFRD